MHANPCICEHAYEYEFKCPCASLHLVPTSVVYAVNAGGACFLQAGDRQPGKGQPGKGLRVQERQWDLQRKREFGMKRVAQRVTLAAALT